MSNIWLLIYVFLCSCVLYVFLHIWFIKLRTYYKFWNYKFRSFILATSHNGFVIFWQKLLYSYNSVNLFTTQSLDLCPFFFRLVFVVLFGDQTMQTWLWCYVLTANVTKSLVSVLTVPEYWYVNCEKTLSCVRIVQFYIVWLFQVSIPSADTVFPYSLFQPAIQ